MPELEIGHVDGSKLNFNWSFLESKEKNGGKKFFSVWLKYWIAWQ